MFEHKEAGVERFKVMGKRRKTKEDYEAEREEQEIAGYRRISIPARPSHYHKSKKRYDRTRLRREARRLKREHDADED